MRRAVPVVIATVLGLVLLANFHTTPSDLSLPAPEPIPTSTLGPADSSSTSSTRPAVTGPPPCTPTSTAPGSELRNIDGTVEEMRWGYVQVRIQVSGDQIVDVTPVQIPLNAEQSREINTQAAPLLHDEVLTAQSAQIDLVSGATLTSEAYRNSLQAALNLAGLC
jgi:uncharacterized protein with FMN-binding domain